MCPCSEIFFRSQIKWDKNEKNVAVNAIIYWNQRSSEVVNSLSLGIGKQASHQKNLDVFPLSNVNHFSSASLHDD